MTAKLEKDIKIGDKKIIKKSDLFKKIKEAVSQGKSISEIDLNDEEKLEIKEYQFLTQKPVLYVLNTNGKSKYSTSRATAKGEEENLFSSPSGVEHLEINLK